ncbi:MAG TPA: hypothetical protein VJM46_03630 [Candidatus Saccharimonadales bacterium]|nr:hypothetical protein [Candidatus Saccharimonadales bacterium]
MVVYFDIIRGLPSPLAIGATEMYFSQAGGGGRVGYSHPTSRRNIVMIDHGAVAGLFRAHLQRIGAQWTESPRAPQGITVHTIDVPTVEEVKAMLAAAHEHYQAALHRLVMQVLAEGRPRRRRRWRR